MKKSMNTERDEQAGDLQGERVSLADRIARWTAGKNSLDTPIPGLRELILAAIEVAQPYGSRNERLMQLLVDEVAVMPSLPLRLPQPSDPDPLALCDALADTPDDSSTLTQWATRLGVDARTIQRRFAKQTGMTLGQWRQQARLITALGQLASGVCNVDTSDVGVHDTHS